jgi:xylan 1,4-beta-xylosidase
MNLHPVLLAGAWRFKKPVGLFLAMAIACCADAESVNTFPVTITVDASRSLGELKPIWRFFGAETPNYAYMKDGQKLLGELGEIGRENNNPVFLRAHHLLTSGDGAYALKFGSTSAYKENADGEPVYDWTINDRIFDACLAHGIKPYVELGLMPEALSTHPQDYLHNPPKNKRAPIDGGESYPPKDYVKWGNLAYEWAKHCIERYGRAEVQRWYWEVWNEPNISYWHGTHADYFRLYDYGVDGVRRALPTAKVGGPENAVGAGRGFLGEFLEHCAHGTNFVTGTIGSPLDFISFHAKGTPVFTNSHVRMGMAHQFQNIDDAFAVIVKFPEFKNLPVVIGETDPDARGAWCEPQDAYRNGTMYSSYTAASFPRIFELAEKRGVNLEGALTYAFEFEDQPPFAGFRQLAGAGIDLPVLNVFRMFGKMGGTRVAVDSSAGLNAEIIRRHNVRGQPDISALAALAQKRLAVLVWHYHDDDIPGPTAVVDLKLAGIPFAKGEATLTHYRVDADHSNSYERWLRMGSPLPLTAQQFSELEKAGQLAELETPKKLTVKDHGVNLSFELPRQGVSLLVLEWP